MSEKAARITCVVPKCEPAHGLLQRERCDSFHCQTYITHFICHSHIVCSFRNGIREFFELFHPQLGKMEESKAELETRYESRLNQLQQLNDSLDASGMFESQEAELDKLRTSRVLMKLTNIRVHTKAPYIKLSRFSTPQKIAKICNLVPRVSLTSGAGEEITWERGWKS